MNTINTFSFNALKAVMVVALTSVVGCSTSHSSAQRSKSAAKISSVQAPTFLTLILEPSKERYVLGEPVYVTVRLKNEGSEPVLGAPNLDPEFGQLNVSVAGGDHKPFRFVPLGILDSDAPRRNLPAGAEVAEVFPVFYGGRGWTFKALGQYTLTATAPVTSKGRPEQAIVRSAAVTITIEAGPTVEPGRLLMEGVQGDEAGKFLTWNSGDHLRKGTGRMLSVMERFPESPLNDYIAFALGKNMSRPFKDYSIPRLRPPDCSTAAVYFKRVRPNSLPSFLQIQMHLAEARCAAVAKDIEAKRRALEEARRLIGARLEFQKLLDQVQLIETDKN